MAGITTLSRILLLLLTAWGVQAVLVFSGRNGLFDALGEVPKTGLQLGTNVPMRRTYTGLKAMDDHLGGLISFFWVMIHGGSPDVSLHSLDFLGQGAAAWVLCVVEGKRAGNRGRLVSYVATMGMFVQNASFAVTIPAYLALHLFTSPTVSGKDARSIGLRTQSSSWITLSLIVGYLAPAILMSLPAPSVISYDQKQIWAAIFQPFPVLVFLVSWTAETLFSSPSTQPLSNSAERKQDIQTLRNVYAFGIACSAIGHIASWTLSLTALFFPSIFNPSFATAFHPALVFLNTWPLSDVKVQNLEEGVRWFLQWDLLNGSSALIIWAYTLHTNAQAAKGKGVRWVGTLLKAGLMSAVVGPCGSALMLVWERDEIVLEEETGKEGKGL